MSDSQLKEIANTLITKGFTRENVVRYLHREYRCNLKRAVRITDELLGSADE